MADELTLEHIDPQSHDLICGLKNEHNEVIADASYNYSKANLFLPYRVCEFPAPINPGDICEFLIQGEWQTAEFLGEWWWHESNKFNNARKFGRAGSSTQMWENRLQEIEKSHGVHVIVCSWDGELRKNHLCRRQCEHKLSKPVHLWVTCKSTSFCCQIKSCQNSSHQTTKFKKAKSRQLTSLPK